MKDCNCIFCKIANGEIPSYTVYEDDDLGEVLKQAEKFKPSKYKSNTKNMIKLIEDFIENN